MTQNVPCKYHFAYGNCKLGTNCKFSHDSHRMAQLECPGWATGDSCSMGAKCPMRHAPKLAPKLAARLATGSSARPVPALSQATSARPAAPLAHSQATTPTACKWHFWGLDCKHGNNCKFSHDRRELRNVDCISYVHGCGCAIGQDRCPMRHEERKYRPMSLRRLMTYSPVKEGSEEWSLISKYIRNTHSPRHGFTVSLDHVNCMLGMGCTERHYIMGLGDGRPRHNKQLLWHGTDEANVCSILQNGFDLGRANKHGMFGPGIYFSNCVTKSAQYCESYGVRYLLLCEVALGDTHECLQADKKNCPRRGTHSTHGIGELAPNPSDDLDRYGVTWPLGKMTKCDKGKGSALAHPEFIVYDISQIAIRYVVQVTIARK